MGQGWCRICFYLEFLHHILQNSQTSLHSRSKHHQLRDKNSCKYFVGWRLCQWIYYNVKLTNTPNYILQCFFVICHCDILSFVAILQQILNFLLRLWLNWHDFAGQIYKLDDTLDVSIPGVHLEGQVFFVSFLRKLSHTLFCFLFCFFSNIFSSSSFKLLQLNFSSEVDQPIRIVFIWTNVTLDQTIDIRQLYNIMHSFIVQKFVLSAL